MESEVSISFFSFNILLRAHCPKGTAFVSIQAKRIPAIDTLSAARCESVDALPGSYQVDENKTDTPVESGPRN